MSGSPWDPLDAALDRAAADGRTVDVWLRDDDAVARTPALEQLAALARRFDLPVLVAVIPEPADRSLVTFLAGQPLLNPTQHGYAHVNHAGPGERACELGGDRPLGAVVDDLARGRDRLAALFGTHHANILVPPWNRIAPALLPDLTSLGFIALSTFADAHGDTTDIAIHNCDLDIIDWRGGRRCHPVGKLATRLAALITHGAPIGILTHHLAHDDEAWAFLDSAFDRLHGSPAIRFIDRTAGLSQLR